MFFFATRAGWKVTKTYDHYTFRQARFKRDFVVMNQNAQKTAKTKVEKDFYKLLNNSNFGNNCRNNIGNSTPELMFDGHEEISYLRKFTNIMQNSKFRQFFSLDLLCENVQQEYKNKKEKLDKNDPFYFALIESLNQKREENLEAIELFAKKKKRREISNRQNTVLESIETKIENCPDSRKNKMVIEFNDHKFASVKSIAVRLKSSPKCTTRFLSGKPLMFAKLSLKSFIYSLVELFSFPEENPIVAKTYDKYEIEQMLCYQVLTDTDSISQQFIIVSEPASTYPGCNVRDILFDIFSYTEIRHRFDKFDEFWRRFGVHCPQNQKVFGLYEVEHIDDPSYVTLAINRKEYLEYFKSEKVNKKHKSIKKGIRGMEYENFAERIKPLYDFDSYQPPKAGTKEVVRISVKKGEMTTHKIVKTKFSQLNNKRFYFPSGILSLPFGHLSLTEIDSHKKSKGQRIEKYFWCEKENLLSLEKKALLATPRLNVLNTILLQKPKIVSVDCTKFDRNTLFLYKEQRQKSILDFILCAGWKEKLRPVRNTSTTGSLSGTFS